MALASTSAQQLHAALHALFHHEDPAVKDQAGKWLEQWQNTTEAWSVSDAVLHDPGSNMEAQYFCAQTLRTKVARDFEELPEGAVSSLRDSLMALLLKFAKGAPPVRTQLCLALTALSMHLPADKWGDGGPVAWFASRLQGQAADAALPCLLELLTVLPQEVNSFKIAVRPERRRQHAQEMRSATAIAIDILTSCLSQAPGVAAGIAERLRPAVLQAFGGWLALSEGAALGPDGSRLPSHPLVVAALEGLTRGDSDVFHAAVDAVCELVWCTVDPETAAVQPAMMPLIQTLVPAIMALRPRFSVASRRAREEGGEGASPARTASRSQDGPGSAGALGASGGSNDEFDDGEDEAKGMARLFAEVGEAYIHLIATAVQEVQAPVEAMLEVAGYPDHAIASMSFNFWHKLAKALNSGWGPRAGGGAGSALGGKSGSMMDVTSAPTPEGETAAAEAARRRAFFAPAFERLAALIRGSVRFPPHSAGWGKEVMSEFKRQRYEIADSLEDCASVLGYPRCLSLVVEPLAECSAAGVPFDWRTAEAVLFCVRAISPLTHSEPPGEPTQLAQLLAALPGLPRNEYLLQVCVCYTIQRYAGWLGTGLNAAAAGGAISQPGSPAAAVPPLLPVLFGLALSGVESPVTAAGAAAALLDLCSYCGSHLAPCLGQLLELYSRVQRAGAGAALQWSSPGAPPPPAATGPAGLQEEDVQQLMQAVCVAVCRCVPPAQVPGITANLLAPVLAALTEAAHQLPPFAPVAPQPGVQSLHAQYPHVAQLLDRLGTLFHYVSHKQAVADMLARSWPALDTVFQRAGGDLRLLERACRALRLGVKGAGSAAGPLLPALLDALAARFRATRHSAFLYILSELIKIFGGEESHTPQLAAVLSSLLVDACSGLTSLAAVTSNPELVDDTYLLASRAAAYAPHLLLWQAVAAGGGPASGPLAPLLDTALVGVLVQHREACCSVLGFLERLLAPELISKVQGSDVAIQAVLGPRAPGLVRLLLAGVVGVLPTSRMGDVAAVLSALLRATAPPPGSAAGVAGSAGLGWLGAAVALLPDSAVPQSDKEALMGAAAAETVRQPGGGACNRAWQGAVDDFADVCRRNPRVRTAAQQALLPPELAGAVVMA